MPEPGSRGVGVFESRAGKSFVRLAAKGGRKKFPVQSRHDGDAVPGDLVVVELLPGRSRRARVLERLPKTGGSAQHSLVAVKAHGIPEEFSPEALREVQSERPAAGETDDDLTCIPFLTIDPPDARDRDDAVHAEPDPEPSNAGGHVIRVAIADVARFVPSGGALDREALRRGNSTYFPDRVVPMLPPALCEDLCSLNEGCKRYCLGVRIVIDAGGNRISHRFFRGVMCSKAALEYEDAQRLAGGGRLPERNGDIVSVIKQLWAAFRSLEVAMSRRQPLRLGMTEFRVALSGAGEIEAIRPEARLEAHRLIEEFMVLANRCAAETLEDQTTAALHRVHDEPDKERISDLARTAVSFGFPFAKGSKTTTSRINQLLDRAADSDCRDHIHLAVLRSMSQAHYSTTSAGHFGLNLRHYTHFTSPIRRYADLVVHRALIQSLGLEPRERSIDDKSGLDQVARHVSMTERRSATAEREVREKFAADFLSDRIGSEFCGTVSGTARAGLFVRLDETGSEGLLPCANLGVGPFRHDRDAGRLTDVFSGKSYRAGMRLSVRLLEAEPLSGALRFEPAEADETYRRRNRKSWRRRRRAKLRRT